MSLSAEQRSLRIGLLSCVGFEYFLVIILSVWGVIAHCMVRVKKPEDVLKPTLFVTLGSALLAMGRSCEITIFNLTFKAGSPFLVYTFSWILLMMGMKFSVTQGHLQK